MAISSRYPASVIAGARAASRLKAGATAPFASINAVQWALESAYGKALSGKNNFFGIKATPAQIAAGKATKRLTHETINGVYQAKDLYFADYDSPAECFAAHTALLTDPKMGWAYSECWSAKDADSYAMALQKHYATGVPGHPYGETLIQWMRRDGLYELDNAADPKLPTKAASVSSAATAAAGAAAAASAIHNSTGSLTIALVCGAIIFGFALAIVAVKLKGPAQ